MARTTVTATPPAPRPVNLRTSARLVEDGARWESGGIVLEPESCSPGGSEDPCAGPATAKEVGDPPALVEWDPYAIYAGASCAYTLNEELIGELAVRARRSLEAQTSHLVEEIFWSNMVDGTDFGATHPNVGLIETATVGTPAPPVSAMRQMDALLIAAIGGRRGMIHVPAPLMHDEAFYGLLEREGQLWVTKTGNIVVPGTGYTGTAPDGTSDAGVLWIYGTSMVELRLSEISTPGMPIQVFDRGTNTSVVIAERQALAYWDRCAHVGVPVCTTDPGPDCGPVS